MTFSPTEPALEVRETDNQIFVRVGGCNALIDSNIEPFNRKLDAVVTALSGHDGYHLLIDLEQIGFLSSAAVAAFLGLNRRVKAGKGRLTLINAQPPIRQVFHVTRLDRVVEIQADGQPR